jgi:hypothetical protein
MQTFIYIIAIIAIAAGGVLWLSTVLGRWSNEMTDRVYEDAERHDYKQTERSMPLNFPEIWLNRVIHNLDNTDKASFLEGISELDMNVTQNDPFINSNIKQNQTKSHQNGKIKNDAGAGGKTAQHLC